MNEVLSVEEMAEADRRAIAAGTTGAALMDAAGRAVADAVAAAHPAEARILVLAGPGNNGGDGFVATRILRERGYRVRLGLLGKAERLTGDAALAFGGVGTRWDAADASFVGEADVIVDALFGAGLARPIEGKAAAIVAAVNASGKPVFAVDLPSGVDGDTGAARGCAISAVHTVTFCRRKPGHLLYPGRGFCGTVEVADIGIPDSVVTGIALRTFVNSAELWRRHWRSPAAEGHKYTRGHVIAACGPAHATGAARLGAQAALRIGAGLVTVASPPDAVAANAAHLTAVMIRPIADASEFGEMLRDARMNAVLIGPGFGVGERTRSYVLAALAGPATAGRTVVVDADGLTSFAEDPADLFEAIAVSGGVKAVFTPHEGEFGRLFGAVGMGTSRLERARAAARRSGAVVVLKGADTVIAAPDGRAAINANAPVWLATAGSGDVLAGIIAGLAAQGVPAFEAAAMGTWCHGEAGSACGAGMISEDLIPALKGVIERLAAG